MALSIFEGHLLDPTPECVESSLGDWCTSTSSRSAEFIDREWEEVGIAWARVEKRGFWANVNSYRVSSKG